MSGLLVLSIVTAQLLAVQCFSTPRTQRSFQRMALETDTETPLSVAGRLNRAVSFYSAAIPIFASYKLLDRQFKFEKETLGRKVSEEKIEAEFKKLHEWGSEILKNKIEDLKGINSARAIKCRRELSLNATIIIFTAYSHYLSRLTWLPNGMELLFLIFLNLHIELGFYVKTGQIISTRVDIFPVEYTSKLASTLDALDPLPAKVVRGTMLPLHCIHVTITSLQCSQMSIGRCEPEGLSL